MLWPRFGDTDLDDLPGAVSTSTVAASGPTAIAAATLTASLATTTIAATLSAAPLGLPPAVVEPYVRGLSPYG